MNLEYQADLHVIDNLTMVVRKFEEDEKPFDVSLRHKSRPGFCSLASFSTLREAKNEGYNVCIRKIREDDYRVVQFLAERKMFNPTW